MKGFRLDGKKFSASAVPRVVQRIIAFLDALPDGDLLNSPELGRKMGYAPAGVLSHRTSDSRIMAYRALIKYPSTRLVWGNKKTIAKLSKHKEILA